MCRDSGKYCGLVRNLASRGDEGFRRFLRRSFAWSMRHSSELRARLGVSSSKSDYDLRFSGCPNVFLTPHTGATTAKTPNPMGTRALDKFAVVLSGSEPMDWVFPHVPPGFAERESRMVSP